MLRICHHVGEAVRFGEVDKVQVNGVKSGQAARRCEPEEPLVVFENGSDDVVQQTIVRRESSMCTCGSIKQQKTLAPASNPESALRVFV